LADNEERRIMAAENINSVERRFLRSIYFEQYVSKDGIFPKCESFWLLIKNGVIKWPLSKLQYLLIDVDYESIRMLDRVFLSQTSNTDVNDEEMFTRVAGLFIEEDEIATTFPKLLECLVKREHSSSPFVNLQRCFEGLDLPPDDTSESLVGDYGDVFMEWINLSLKNRKSLGYFEYQLKLWDTCQTVFEQNRQYCGFDLAAHLHRLDHKTWSLLFSKFHWLFKTIKEPLPFFLGYSQQINSVGHAGLNRQGQIQDPNEVFSNDDMADVVRYRLWWGLSKVFGLNSSLKLASKKLADILLSQRGDFNPVGLLYYTEGDFPMPEIEWMSKFSPNYAMNEPYFQYEHDLYFRILKNIHKIPTKNYPGLLHKFGTCLIKHLPEPMLLDVLEQTKKSPKIEFLPYYVEHFNVLYDNVEEVKETFFNRHNLEGHCLTFLPLYAKIFRCFGNQASEFLGWRGFLKMTWMVVEFFSNLPSDEGTEIKSEPMERIKTFRADIWSWINRQFDIVDKGESCLLTRQGERNLNSGL